MDNILRKKRNAGCKTYGNHTKGEKKCQPCRNLYSPDFVTGRSTTKHISSECWAHEFEDGAAALYVDPVLGDVLPLSELEEIAKVQCRIKRGLGDGECQMVRKRGGNYTIIWTPRVCWMSHPGEANWFAGWMADSAARAPNSVVAQQQQPKRDFGHMAAGGGGGGGGTRGYGGGGGGGGSRGYGGGGGAAAAGGGGGGGGTDRSGWQTAGGRGADRGGGRR
jgi:hypothetical protein